MYLKSFLSSFSSYVENRRILDVERIFQEFLRLSQYFGIEEINVENSLIEISRDILFDAIVKFKNNDFDRGHRNLRKLSKLAIQYGPKHTRTYVSYFTNIAHAMGYFFASDWTRTIKYSNPAITNCPKIGDFFLVGLTDALLMISESYSALGDFEDALLSARLAVTTAHSRLEHFKKMEEGQQQQISSSPWMTTEIIPSLRPYNTVYVAYFNLGYQLERNSFGTICVEWYDRSYQLAQRFESNLSIIEDIKNSVQLSQIHVPKALKTYKDQGTHHYNQDYLDSSSNADEYVEIYHRYDHDTDDHSPEKDINSSLLSHRLSATTSNSTGSSNDNENDSRGYLVGNNISPSQLRTRPKSALPRLDSSADMLDINYFSMEQNQQKDYTGTSAYNRLRQSTIISRITTQTADEEHSQTMSISFPGGGGGARRRPKSANSKLGESYSADYMSHNGTLQDGMISLTNNDNQSFVAVNNNDAYRNEDVRQVYHSPTKVTSSRSNRKQVQALQVAATAIQSIGRQYIACKRVNAIRKQKAFINRRSIQRKAVIKIQCLTRGFLSRLNLNNHKKLVKLIADVKFSEFNNNHIDKNFSIRDNYANENNRRLTHSNSGLVNIIRQELQKYQASDLKNILKERQILEDEIQMKLKTFQEKMNQAKFQAVEAKNQAEEYQVMTKRRLENDMQVILRDEIDNILESEKQKIALEIKEKTDELIASQYTVGSQVIFQVDKMPSNTSAIVQSDKSFGRLASIIRCRSSQYFDLQLEDDGSIYRFISSSSIKLVSINESKSHDKHDKKSMHVHSVSSSPQGDIPVSSVLRQQELLLTYFKNKVNDCEGPSTNSPISPPSLNPLASQMEIESYRVQTPKSTLESLTLQRGDRVEARCCSDLLFSSSPWMPGKIQNIHSMPLIITNIGKTSNSKRKAYLYDVVFEHGIREDFKPAEDIKLLSFASSLLNPSSVNSAASGVLGSIAKERILGGSFPLKKMSARDVRALNMDDMNICVTSLYTGFRSRQGAVSNKIKEFKNNMVAKIQALFRGYAVRSNWERRKEVIMSSNSVYQTRRLKNLQERSEKLYADMFARALKEVQDKYEEEVSENVKKLKALEVRMSSEELNQILIKASSVHSFSDMAIDVDENTNFQIENTLSSVENPIALLTICNFHAVDLVKQSDYLTSNKISPLVVININGFSYSAERYKKSNDGFSFSFKEIFTAKLPLDAVLKGKYKIDVEVMNSFALGPADALIGQGSVALTEASTKLNEYINIRINLQKGNKSPQGYLIFMAKLEQVPLGFDINSQYSNLDNIMSSPFPLLDKSPPRHFDSIDIQANDFQTDDIFNLVDENCLEMPIGLAPESHKITENQTISDFIDTDNSYQPDFEIPSQICVPHVDDTVSKTFPSIESVITTPVIDPVTIVALESVILSTVVDDEVPYENIEDIPLNDEVYEVEEEEEEEELNRDDSWDWQSNENLKEISSIHFPNQVESDFPDETQHDNDIPVFESKLLVLQNRQNKMFEFEIERNENVKIKLSQMYETLSKGRKLLLDTRKKEIEHREKLESEFRQEQDLLESVANPQQSETAAKIVDEFLEFQESADSFVDTATVKDIATEAKVVGLSEELYKRYLLLESYVDNFSNTAEDRALMPNADIILEGLNQLQHDIDIYYKNNLVDCEDVDIDVLHNCEATMMHLAHTFDSFVQSTAVPAPVTFEGREHSENITSAGDNDVVVKMVKNWPGVNNELPDHLFKDILLDDKITTALHAYSPHIPIEGEEIENINSYINISKGDLKKSQILVKTLNLVPFITRASFAISSDHPFACIIESIDTNECENIIYSEGFTPSLVQYEYRKLYLFPLKSDEICDDLIFNFEFENENNKNVMKCVLTGDDILSVLANSSDWTQLSLPLSKYSTSVMPIQVGVRGSILSVDSVLRQFVDLWDTHIGRAFQILLIKATIMEQIGDTIVETAYERRELQHSDNSSVIKDESINNLLGLLTSSKLIYSGFVSELKKFETNLQQIISSWEFDFRRQSTGSSSPRSQGIDMIEILLSKRLQAVSMQIFSYISPILLNLTMQSNNDTHSSGSNSATGLSLNVESSYIWNNVEGVLMNILHELMKQLHLQDDQICQDIILNMIKPSCLLIIDIAVEHLKTYDWTQWALKNDVWMNSVGEDSMGGIMEIVEKIIFSNEPFNTSSVGLTDNEIEMIARIERYLEAAVLGFDFH